MPPYFQDLPLWCAGAPPQTTGALFNLLVIASSPFLPDLWKVVTSAKVHYCNLSSISIYGIVLFHTYIN